MDRLVRVSDPEDPALAPFRDVRERDLVGRDGFFVAEGEVVLRLLLGPRSRFGTAAILVSEGRAERLRGLLDGAGPDVPIHVAGRDAMDRIVGFPIHRGILALGIGRTEPPLAPFLAALPAHALVLVLVGIANHDNVGGAFRNAAAFGADAVLLDSGSCDPLYRKAIRVSVGASLVVPWRRGGTAGEIVAALGTAGFGIVALTPGARETLDAVRWPDRTALVVGSEGPGLPGSVLDAARPVAIRMAPGFDSLNLATASGIALHAVRSAGDPPDDPGDPPDDPGRRRTGD